MLGQMIFYGLRQAAFLESLPAPGAIVFEQKPGFDRGSRAPQLLAGLPGPPGTEIICGHI
jgi:hypothetical protein